MLLAGKRKYTHKTFCEKCQALKDLEIGESNKNIAAKYNLPKNTLSTWVKNKEKLFDALKKGTNVKTQKMKSGNHDSGFMALAIWLWRWKEGNNISFKTVSGESKSVTPDTVNAWSVTSLPTLLSNYNLKEICNADEF